MTLAYEEKYVIRNVLLIKRDNNMVMNQRRSLLGGSGMVEVFFSVVASTYFVKEGYLMKHEIPVM